MSHTFVHRTSRKKTVLILMAALQFVGIWCCMMRCIHLDLSAFRSILTTSCISILCELLAREESNVTEKPDLYGAQREYSLRQKWLSGLAGLKHVTVLDLPPF